MLMVDYFKITFRLKGVYSIMIGKLSSYQNLNFTYRLDEFTNIYAVQSWKDFHDAIFHTEKSDPKIKRYTDSDLQKKSISNRDFEQIRDNSESENSSSGVEEKSKNNHEIKKKFSLIKYLQYSNNSLHNEYKRYIKEKSPLIPVIPAIKYLVKFVGYILVGLVHKTLFFLAKISSFLLNVFGKSNRDYLKQQKLANPNSWYKLKLGLLILIDIITFIPFKTVGLTLKILTLIIAIPLKVISRIASKKIELEDVEVIKESIELLNKIFINHKGAYIPSNNELQIVQNLVNIMSLSNGEISADNHVICKDYDVFKNRFLELQPKSEEMLPMGNSKISDQLSHHEFAQLAEILIRYGNHITMPYIVRKKSQSIISAEFANQQIKHDLARMPKIEITLKNGKHLYIPSGNSALRSRLDSVPCNNMNDLIEFIKTDKHFDVARKHFDVETIAHILTFIVSQSIQAQTFEALGLKSKNNLSGASSGEAPRLQRLKKFAIENQGKKIVLTDNHNKKFTVDSIGAETIIQCKDFEMGFPYSFSHRISNSTSEKNGELKFKVSSIQTHEKLAVFTLMSETLEHHDLDLEYSDITDPDQKKVNVWLYLMGGAESFMFTAKQSIIMMPMI